MTSEHEVFVQAAGWWHGGTSTGAAVVCDRLDDESMRYPCLMGTRWLKETHMDDPHPAPLSVSRAGGRCRNQKYQHRKGA